MANKRSSRSAAKAEVNRQVRVAVRRFDRSDDASEVWTFLCECGASGCKQWVTLTLAEFEELQHEGRAILAPGHQLTRAQKARRDARALVDDATALKAEARHQASRAARNVRSKAE